MKLYELRADMRDLLDRMDEYVDEETGEIQADYQKLLTDLGGDIKEKIEGIGVVVREITGDIDILKAEKKRLGDRQTSLERRKEWLLNYASDTMRTLDIPKHTSPHGLFTVYMQKNPDAITVEYPDNLPMKYQRVRPVEPMLDALKTDLKSGAIKTSDPGIAKAGINVIEGQRKVRYK